MLRAFLYLSINIGQYCAQTKKLVQDQTWNIVHSLAVT